MTDAIRTAGDLRGFLAEVLVGIREKRIRPDEAGAIAKVAAEINRSLAVEVQTQLQAGVKAPVVGGMLITNSVVVSETSVNDTQTVLSAPTEPPEIITDIIRHDPISETKAAPTKPKAGIVELAKRDADKLWCEQCDMRVAVSQALACRSPHCKAKEAA